MGRVQHTREGRSNRTNETRKENIFGENRDMWVGSKKKKSRESCDYDSILQMMIDNK